MYIDCKTFNKWLRVACDFKGISPGAMAKDFKVSRQTVNNWINDDVINAYSYDGKEGKYVIINMETEYDKVHIYRKNVYIKRYGNLNR